jgi:hypothetical protein
MLCATFSMLDGPVGTDCNEVCFPVYGGWDRRDVSVVRVRLCERVYVFCNVVDHLICRLGIVYNVCISHIVCDV